ncbi:hypothetical protein HH308_12740 [Gordonia sp. TBRC 11910]|uniref:Alkaline shock response membrane anchor protein AmaP n=1 Tax=Gordonia asplenii TaxID=2725283 RepID=A0A848KV00_9ACTN|nr:hypothetical protein [Gordonia asplenii]NMO02079.1 hypothetical protein [Gordonia asplenii]
MNDHGTGNRRAPAANPSAILAGALIGLGLLGVAAIALRDLTVRAGWVTGSEWLRTVPRWTDRLTWQAWMWPAAIGLIVVGLAMVWLSIRPRRKEYDAVPAAAGLWTRPADIARRCSSVARTQPGVATASTVVGRRKVRVTVGSGGPVDVIAVERAVKAELAQAGTQQRVSVRVRRRATPTVSADGPREETVKEST